MAGIHRARSPVDHYAALSHERSLGNNDVSSLCWRVNGGQSKVFRLPFLGDALQLSGNFVRLCCVDAVVALENLSLWSSRRLADRSTSLFDVRLSAPSP